MTFEGMKPTRGWDTSFLSTRTVHILVRDILGCGCPDDVFENIQVGRPRLFKDWKGPVSLQILVGWRLLVSLVDAGTLNHITEDCQALLEEGRMFRDKRGLNRFRLVLVGHVESHVVHQLEDLAARVDEKVHVHVVPLEAMPNVNRDDSPKQ